MGNNCKGICYSNDSATKSLVDNMENIDKLKQQKIGMSIKINSGNNFSKNFDEDKNIKVDENGVSK